MKLSVNGLEAFVATGGRPFDASLPTVVFLHGAGFDHTAWALHDRWFAHPGFAVATMTVGPDLLKAAETNDQAAVDMVSIWGLGFNAELGGSLAPGLWMHGGAQNILRRCKPGVLFNDLAACNCYQNALAAAARISVPTTLILGERDMMTPARAGKSLAAAIAHSRTIVLPSAGHILMSERPDELLAALRP
jgi:pimeloyl-ACP methyl ester carboxylesterase